jgi:hypothetical protein
METPEAVAPVVEQFAASGKPNPLYNLISLGFK